MDQPATLESINGQIAKIDRDIDLTVMRAKLRKNFGASTAAEWSFLWGQCPDLHTKFRSLYAQRGALQAQRDTAEHKLARVDARRAHREISARIAA